MGEPSQPFAQCAHPFPSGVSDYLDIATLDMSAGEPRASLSHRRDVILGLGTPYATEPIPAWVLRVPSDSASDDGAGGCAGDACMLRAYAGSTTRGEAVAHAVSYKTTLEAMLTGGNVTKNIVSLLEFTRARLRDMRSDKPGTRMCACVGGGVRGA